MLTKRAAVVIRIGLTVILKFHFTPVLLLSVSVTACGFFDAQTTYVPDVFRAKKPAPEVPDPEPDATAFVTGNAREIFAGEVANIRVGQPRRKGLHWELCVASLAKGATGIWSDAILIVEIKRGRIESRRRAVESDQCDVHG
jgi:hypothetical protein